MPGKLHQAALIAAIAGALLGFTAYVWHQNGVLAEVNAQIMHDNEELKKE
jgi:hypothetical protein